jgi:hypothetical protein
MFAVQGFDGGVDVQYPVHVQCGLHDGHDLGCEPVLALLCAQARGCAAQRVFADDSVHAQHLWAHRIRAQGGDVGVPVVPSQYAQQPSAKHVFHGGGVGAGVVQGTTVDSSLVDTVGGQKLGKEGQLCVGGGAGHVVPLHVESTTGRVHDHGIFCLFLTYQLPSFCFTHLVINPNRWSLLQV